MLFPVHEDPPPWVSSSLLNHLSPLPSPSLFQSPPTLQLRSSQRLLLLNRRVQLALTSGASRPSPRPLGLLCHLCLSAQLLVGVDHICLLGRHFLALDDSQAGSRWRVGSGGGSGCGCRRGWAARTRSIPRRSAARSWRTCRRPTAQSS